MEKINLLKLIKDVHDSPRKFIHMHHSESPVTTTPEEINRWHIDRGFKGIGYHFVINKGREGDQMRIFSCRPLSTDPASIEGHNKDAIAVCFCGNYDEYHLSAEFNLVKSRLLDLARKTGKTVYYHRDLNNKKTCPGLLF